MTNPRRLLLCVGVAAAALAQSQRAAALELPATAIAYRIEAELDPATRALTGTEEIRWKNVTGEPISTLPLHLYLNAFSHDRTTWMQGVAAERLQFGDLLKREPDPWGYIDPVSIRQRLPEGERDAAWQPIQPDDKNPLDRSLAEVTLASPVPPGGELVLTIGFEARLPVPIARTGGRGDYFLVAQWYPKIGVLEYPGVRHAPKVRSAARQFHGPTEFYADFADYDVTFKVPAGWLVGATGRAEGEPAPDGQGRVAVRYKQRAVHDVALVAGAHLKDEWARYAPKGGGPPVDIRIIVPAGTEPQIPRWRKAAEGALDVLGSRVGPYPYETLTVVMTPYWANRTSGMEYPTLITGVPGDPIWDHPLLAGHRLPEDVIIHEFGHQYFYGLLASNEQEEAFLDEGFNSYWEDEMMRALYGTEASWGHLLGRRVEGGQIRTLGLERVSDKIHEPMRKEPSWLFAEETSGSQIYARSAVTFATAAALFGQEKVDRVFAEYFRRFVFKHPDADDFLGVADEIGGPEFAAYCREALERPEIPDFAVTEINVEAWKPPLGRVIVEGSPVMLTREDQAKRPELGIPAEAKESDGRILMEVTDSGWVHHGQSRMGAMTRTLVTPEKKERQGGYPAEGFYESSVRIEGPGWESLPVDIELRFADGAVVHDAWDGKSAWRAYRFLRPAPLLSARIDPAGKIAVDVKPQNNARSADPDSGFLTDWGLWLGATAEWLAGGLSLWL